MRGDGDEFRFELVKFFEAFVHGFEFRGESCERLRPSVPYVNQGSGQKHDRKNQESDEEQKGIECLACYREEIGGLYVRGEYCNGFSPLVRYGSIAREHLPVGIFVEIAHCKRPVVRFICLWEVYRLRIRLSRPLELIGPFGFYDSISVCINII